MTENTAPRRIPAILEITGDQTKVIDLKGRFVMPGLHDLHLHFEGFYNATMLEG